MATVVVVGLGPAGPELLTLGARAAIEGTGHRFVRTTRHPSAEAAAPATSFDALYDTASTLEEVYEGIVERLIGEARGHGRVLYAVPGSPLVAERTVELLRERAAAAGVGLEVVPGLSFLDLAWSRLGVDPVAAGVRLIDGRRFAVEAAGERGPLLVAQCDSRDVLSEVKLAVEGDPPPARVVVLHHLGLGDESVRELAWADLDREVEPDHLTALYVPELAAPVAGEVMRFAELVRTLRSRCPWDQEQTHVTLTRHLLEETYEVLEAIRDLDGAEAGGEAADIDLAAAYAHLEEELGDLLFQVVFHATLAAEAGRFNLADVAVTVHDKLVGRHPHVFGDVVADNPGQVMRNWEQIKRAEKGATSLMDGLPSDLPSLLYAHKVQRKAASVGVEAEPLAHAADRLAALAADALERRDPDAVGALLFETVAMARHIGVDPEYALRGAAADFRDRFVALERLAAEQGTDPAHLDGAALAALWRQVGAGRSPQP